MGEKDWYSPEELLRWDGAIERGLDRHAEWFAEQLNAAYRKGQQNGSLPAIKRLVEAAKRVNGIPVPGSDSQKRMRELGEALVDACEELGL